MLLPFYLILIKTNEPSLSLSYGSQFAEFLYDCYLIYAFVFSTSLLVTDSRYGLFTYLFYINMYLLIFFQHISHLRNVVIFSNKFHSSL